MYVQSFNTIEAKLLEDLRHKTTSILYTDGYTDGHKDTWMNRQAHSSMRPK